MQILAYGGSKPTPFQRAITESQILEPGITINYTATAWSNVVALTTCSTTSDPNSNATLQCMRNLPVDDLVDAMVEEYIYDDNNVGDIWLPIVDGDFLPKAPSELLSAGEFANVESAIIGWTEDDAAFFTDPDIATDEDTVAFVSSYLIDLDDDNLAELLELYPVSDFEASSAANLSAEFYRSARLFRDILFVCPSLYFGHALAKKQAGLSDIFSKRKSRDGEEYGSGQTYRPQHPHQPESGFQTRDCHSHDTTSVNINAKISISINTDPVTTANISTIYHYIQNQTLLTPILDALGYPGRGIIHSSEIAYVFGNLSIFNLSTLR